MAATIATTGRTATRPWNIVGTVTIGCTAGNERRNGQASAPTRCSPLRSMVFKISNDSIVICRYPSDTVPWDSAMDRGNLSDLAAFVLADQASFLCEGTSRQWVNRVILTERRSLPLYPDKQTIS